MKWKYLALALILTIFSGCDKDNESDTITDPGNNEPHANVVINTWDQNLTSGYPAFVYYTGAVENIGSKRATNVLVEVVVYCVVLEMDVTLQDNVGSLDPGASASFSTSNQNTQGGFSWRSISVYWSE